MCGVVFLCSMHCCNMRCDTIAPGDGKACHGKPIGFNAIFSTFQMVAITIKTTKRYHDAMPTALIDASRKRAYRNWITVGLKVHFSWVWYRIACCSSAWSREKQPRTCAAIQIHFPLIVVSANTFPSVQVASTLKALPYSSVQLAINFFPKSSETLNI